MQEKIWICEECNRVLNQEEKQKHDDDKEWGHHCIMHPRSKKPWRCESYLKEYVRVK